MMISIKKMLLVIVSIVGFTSLHSSSKADQPFEIYNKANDAIAIELFSTAENKPGIKATIEPNRTYSSGTIPKKFTINNSNGRIHRVSITDQTVKKAYLTFDPSKRYCVYPQTGTYKGLSNTSNSGHSLSDNIKIGQFTLEYK